MGRTLNINCCLKIASMVFICTLLGCSSWNLDVSKKKEEKENDMQRSPYSILTDAGEGVVIDPGNIDKDLVRIPDLSEVLHPHRDEPFEAENPEKKEIGRKDTDALYKKLFPDQQEEGESEYIKVSINFDAANLGDVIPAFATPLKMNYILDPGVTGTITMSVKSNFRPREVWTLFEQILQMAGAYCEMENQVVHIRPISKITQEKKMLRPDSNIEVQLVPLKFITPQDIAAQLKNFLSDTATATPLERQNAILLVENSANIERLILLIEQLDRRSKDGWQRAVFNCRYVQANQIVEELLSILPVLGFPVIDGKQTSGEGEIGIVSIDRLQTIVASAVTKESIQEIQKWIKNLDRPDSGDQDRVYLYEVVNGKAEELLSALDVIFSVEGSVMSAETAGGASTGSGQGAKSTKTNVSSLSSSSGNKSSEELKSNNIFDAPVKVFADAVHNRLLIRTTPRTYAIVRAILDRMDTIPAQILMQVLVVEIELSDNNEFGMEFAFTSGGSNNKSIYGTNFEQLKPNTGDGMQTGGSFTIFNPKNPDEKFGYIRALASKNKMTVLSSPQIVVKSNAKAKFSVGKRVPTISNEITDTQSITPGDTSLRRSYVYEETGIILEVSPQVTKGGMISMDIEQTISDAIDNNMKGMDTPIIKQDILETTLAIRDGRTIIMGGLIREKQTEVITSLPWIADVPFLRTLLGNTSKATERTEILVLVTATIIREQNDLEAMVRRYNQAVREIDKFELRQYHQEQIVEKEHEKVINEINEMENKK